MEITRRSSPDGLELVLEGRLDAYWAEHLTSTLDEAIRDGAVQLSLDLAGVRYLRSGGIRAILIAHRELERVGGALRLGRLSEAVRSMLEMAGLLDKLALQPVEPTPVAEPRRSIDVAGCRLDVWEAPRPSSLTARRIGEPERLSSGYGREDCHEVVFPAPGFGLGLGALGSGFDDCRDRFGELVAIAGAQAHQPTDGTNKPDFLVTSSARTPAASLLYGLVCSGEPAVHARFRPSESPIELSALARAALELSAADAAALVVVAESAGLVGAALRRSPAGTEGAPDFSFPRVRRWLSFTAEKAWPGAQA
ncbi:MAG: STAS domain-containing protein, partial [Thermoanaerobaculia bacterium]|nr:STAS domain-containing protein [Thermoanaerobaculia bacterium]